MLRSILVDPSQRATVERIRLERSRMRVCCHGTLLCLGLFVGFTLAAIVRYFRGYQDPPWFWALVLIPTIAFALQFALMFHVERLYRKVGL